MMAIERPEHTIRHGWLKKKGEKRTNWNRRYVFLNVTYLRYYDRDDGGFLKGQLLLKTINEVRPSNHYTKECKPGESIFEVETSDRVWYFIAESDESGQFWMSAIKTGAENSKREEEKGVHRCPACCEKYNKGKDEKCKFCNSLLMNTAQDISNLVIPH